MKALAPLLLGLLTLAGFAGEPELAALVQNPDPAIRAAAAAEIRALLAAGTNEIAPGNIIEHERQYWTERLALLKPGMTREQIARRLGIAVPSGVGLISSGQSSLENWPLDHTHRLSLSFQLGAGPPAPARITLAPPPVPSVPFLDEDNSSTLVSATLDAEPERRWITPPAHFSGQWLTYFITGQPCDRIDYADGKYHGEFVSYHPNGEIQVQQHYEHGVCTGADRGFYKSGKPAYVGEYHDGRQVGKWQHFSEDGRVRNEQNFDTNGRREGSSRGWNKRGVQIYEIVYHEDHEIGQAGWNEEGVLQYDRRPAR